MPRWLYVSISAVSDFVITAGTGYSVAAAAGSGAVIPPTAQIVLCVVGGLIQAARGVQKTLSPPPT
jgi:hypothetical protein